MESEILIQNAEQLKDKIYVIRGVQVMLDSDLAEIYGYSTKDFNRQVKNNIEKFDEDFMFQLTTEEFNSFLRCKISTTKTETRGGRQYNPYVFTEQGVYMLMTVLKGELATKQSKKIYHCGASSKDGGRKVTTITLTEDTSVYKSLVAQLLQNKNLVLN